MLTVNAGADYFEMPEFLTDEWVAWLDVALSGCGTDAALDLVLEHRVTADDGTVFAWHVRVAGGRLSATVGPSDASRDQGLVRFSSDRETARAIALEGRSAQRAFAEGRLHLDGDPRLLIAARPALQAIGAALAASG